MTPGRMIVFVIVTAFIADAAPAESQVFDRLKKKVEEVKNTADDAHELRCDVQGVCGEVWQSELFGPEMYESLAVTVFDGTGRYRSHNIDGMVRNPFEGTLLDNGFLLAASSDAAAVRKRIGRSEDEWNDEDLAQLTDFVHGIDAVIVVQIDDLDMGRCELETGTYGTQATVHLSARWLNVDAGDIPWVAKHRAAACEDGGAAALSTALDKVATQLSSALPVRD